MIFWEKQKVLTTFYEKMTKPVCEKYNLTQMEYDIVMFLYNNPEYKTASDIVKIRKLAKSHVSSGLASLESKGYISKHYQDGNKKSVILEITAMSENLIHDGKQAQTAFGQTIFDGFSEEEMNLCRNMFSKMCENANKALTKKGLQKERL